MQVVKMLLDKGADVNALSDTCDTALRAASSEGHEQLVELLLDKGANVNAQGGHHGNALQAALERGHKAVVQLLLERAPTSTRRKESTETHSTRLHPDTASVVYAVCGA
jgi:ankyrin repeat protein